jgi:hypothetical protein
LDPWKRQKSLICSEKRAQRARTAALRPAPREKCRRAQLVEDDDAQGGRGNDLAGRHNSTVESDCCVVKGFEFYGAEGEVT